MAVQINVAANQAALTASIQAGVQAYNQRFAQNNQLNLTVNQRAFSQPLGRMTGDVKDFEAALAASNARVIAFGASTAVLGGVIRSFKELTSVTIDVEKNLADINRVFGLSTSQLQKFSSELFNVGKQTASTFDDASKAALEFSRQGLKAEEVLTRTKDALTLTRLAGIGTANAVDALTSTVNGFAATGVTTTQILNKLVAVEQDYAVGAGDLAEALSRTGQAAQEAGVSLDQLNALVTAAQQSTARGGAVIGNALKTIFTRLQRSETLDQLEAFNIAVRDVQGNTLPAVTVLQNFAGAYKNLGDAQRAQLSEQVAGVYQVNILKAIVGDLNKSQGVYAGALQKGASATNEAEVATAKLNQTLDALLKQTATSTQQLANNIGKVTFEPLAKYGTEQLKSLVESMNEVLEGEGVGSTFANGLLKGIRNVIAGPGAIAAFFTLFKLIQNSFTYLSQALPQIAGITTETQNRKNIEQSILQIMQQQGPASQALAGLMGNQAAQAQLLLQIARQQTAEYQMQSTLAKQLAVQLAGQGVRVKGSGGLQVTRAGGYIPASTKMAEVVGAKAGGYAPGRVVSSPVGGVMNTAEDVKYIPGFAQPFINPPAGSKAGRAHRQNAINRTGVDPYMFRGFIPNFAEMNKKFVTDKINIKDGDTISGYPVEPLAIDYRLSEVDAVESNQKFNEEAINLLKSRGYDKAEKLNQQINDKGKAAYYRGVFSDKSLAKDLINKGYAVPDLRYTKDFDLINLAKQNYNEYWKTNGNPQGLWKYLVHPKNKQFQYQAKLLGVDLGIMSRDSIATETDVNKKGIKYKKTSPAGEKVFGDKYNKLYKKLRFEGTYEDFRGNYNSGFIPNFATPMSTASIPWFKKYSSKYKNAAGDTDLFKMGDFPTYGRGLDHEYAKKGNSAMLSYLHEDFVKSALNIALGSKKVIRPAEVGFKNKPVSDIANENDFDLLYRIADGSYSMLELKQDFKNVSGSVTGFMNKKLANLEKENPALAKKVSSMIAVSNRPKFTDPTGRNAGANFSEFEMAAASIVKDKYSNVDPSISAKLTKVTDGLLRRYEAKKNTTYDGFIPNFASRREMFRDLVKFNLESAPDNQNILGGKTTLFRGVTNNKNSVFGQSRKHSQTENDRDYFRDTDINKIANDHVLEKKLLPFVSASTDKDIAEYFARGRRDDNLLGSGVVGSKTIKNSRIFSEQSIRKFTDKYGEKALKDIMLELSNWGSFGYGKGMAVNFQSFSQKKGFEGTDFAKEISFLNNGFIPNLANFIDVDSLGKNSVHYSGDLMQLIKDIEASIGRNLSSGELRFLTNPKTNLSKLNDPKVLNKFINSERKGGFAGFANGFVPNFAYKQAVMGLEERMSGNKAILDTSTGPFPFIRNTGQANFADAVADHGGLNNALSDSMRGQKAAGLMNRGFVPNFARGDKGITGRNIDFSTTVGGMMPGMGSRLSDEARKKLLIAINDEIKSFKEGKISRDQLTDNTKKLMVAQNLSIKAQEDLNKKINTNVKSVELQNQENKKSLSSKIFGKKGQAADAFASSKLGGVAGLLGGAMIGGQIESFIQGGRERYQMSAGEKFGASAGSGILTAATTGAEIGAFIPVLGPAAGAAIGGLIGLGKAAYDAQETLGDMQKSAEDYASITTKTIEASKNYIQQLSDLGSITNAADKNIASFKLQETFDEINKVSPELGKKFLEAGGDIGKMQDAIQEFVKTTTIISSAKKVKSNLFGASLEFADMAANPDREKFLKKRGYDINKSFNIKNNEMFDISQTEGSLEASFRQFSGFLEIIRTSGMSAEKATSFMEEFANELSSFYVSESKLKEIGIKFGLAEELATQLASTGDNVIEEMGIVGKFFIKNSSVLVKKMFDATADKFKTAGQTIEKAQFNAQPILKRIEDSISNYVYGIASQIQSMEFESSRFKILENAANDYLDSISTPLEKASREITSRNRETQNKIEESRIRFTSNFEQNVGSKLPKTLGGSNVDTIQKLETLIESFKTSSPEQQLEEINKLIKNTTSIETAGKAGYENIKPEEIKSLNAELIKERDSLMLLMQAKRENISLTTLENDVAKRKAESTERLLILQNKLIESDTKRAISIASQKANIDIRENDLQNTRKTPGFGFGMSEGDIARQAIGQNRILRQDRETQTRNELLGVTQSQIKNNVKPIIDNINLEISSIYEKINQDAENVGNVYGESLNKAFDKLAPFSKLSTDANQVKSLEELQSVLQTVMSTLDKNTDKTIFSFLNQQLETVSKSLIDLNKEYKIFESNSQADIKTADVNDRINNAYIFRLNTLLQIEKTQRGILNTIEIEEQRLDAAKSRPANFFGLGVTGKAEKQIGFDEQNLALRQRRQNAQATQNVQQQLNQFEIYRSKIKAESINPLLQEGSYGPLNQEQTDRAEKARKAIANLDTSKITNVDQAKDFVQQLSKVRIENGLQGEAAKTLADTEKEINSILNSNVDELDKMRSIQDILNSKVRQEAKDRQSIRMGLKEGFDQIQEDADTGLNRLAKDTPILFRDGMVDAIKATIRETDNLDAALMGIASKFLDTFSTQLMNTGISKIISGSGLGSVFGAQTGGLIRAQSGMYISGTGTGDKYPALLENGEYVLNRNAVSAMGGPSVLDSLNFSMAPRFAAGGSYSSKFIDLKSMEANMTSEGLENSSLYRDALDAEKQNQQAQRQKKMQRKQQRAAMIGQLAAAAATIAIGAGLSNMSSNAKAMKAQQMSKNMSGPGANPLMMTGKEFSQLKQFQSSGLISSGGSYIGGNTFTGFKSFLSKPTYGETWYQRAGSAISKPFGRRQTGGIIGSRLSDTIPGYMEGGLYNTPIVNRYGAGMQNGGSSIMAAGNSSSITNNNTNANNSFNFNTTVERDGTIKMGSNTTSYEQQDVELSKNLNERVYAVVSEVIRKEKQFGGSLAGVRG